MSLSWNLLNYPALHQKRRRRHRITSSLAGLAVGVLMAGASLFGMERSLQDLALQKSLLQAQWGEASQQLKLAQQRAAARESSQNQAQHLRQVLEQHQAWTALNQALHSEAQEASWRLVRLQLAPGKLELSGWSRDFDALNASRQRLTDLLHAAWPESLAQENAPNGATQEDQHLSPSSVKGPVPSTSAAEQVRQTSVSVRAGADLDSSQNPAGLEFVWVSPWPTFKPKAAPAQSMAHQGAAP